MPIHSRRRKRPILSRVKFQPGAGPPVPAPVTAFLADASSRIDTLFELWSKSRTMGFFPSDYDLAHDVLRFIRETNPEARRLCEWGSGLGVVAGLGAILGFESCGIEIDKRWVGASRTFLKDHGLDVTILEGSFIPEEFAEENEMKSDGTGTVLWGPGAIDEVDVEIEDFDVIFAFPWPDEEEMYYDLFSRYASVGAVLATYSALDGMLVQRKMSG